MADNVQFQTSVTATPPTATVISTEEVTTLNGGAVSAQHVQRVAVASRTADGTVVDLPASTADGLLVNLGSNNDVTVTGAVTATVSGVATAAKQPALGTAGTPSSDVISIQGVASGTVVPVSDGGGSLTVDGTVTADTELPAAAALADNTSNPTAPAVGAFGMLWDGATWDRAPGTAADGLLVNLGANNDVTVTGTVTATVTGVATAANQSTEIARLDTLITHVDGQEALLAALLTETTFGTRAGALTETAPATDTASSGLNGRLQRIAQRITSLIALLPAALGQTTKAGSLSVTLASDQDALPVTDNGGSLTVDGTVTANAGSGTFAISAASLPLPSGASTAAKQPALGTAGSASTDVLTVQGIVSMTALKVDGSAVTQPVLLSSDATTVSAALTRPADTNAYAANDEASSSTTAPTILTFSDVAKASGGTGTITDALLVDSANQATKGQFELWLFNTTHTPDNDNAAFAPSDTEVGYVVAILPFTAWYPGDDTAGADGNAIATYSGPPIDYKTSGSANLFGRIKVKNAYTPVSAEVLTFKLKVRRDG